MLRMDSGLLFDVMRPNATFASFGQCPAQEPWTPPNFSCGGHEDSLAETYNVLKELDSGGSSPMAPKKQEPAGQTSSMDSPAQAPKAPPPKTRRRSYSEADRLERRRARNRAAQARFRQKQRVRWPHMTSTTCSPTSTHLPAALWRNPASSSC